MNKMKQINRGGFTLIELLVAIAIIAILMGLVVGISGVANRKSAEAKARAELQTISAALEEYRLVEGTYPLTLAAMTNANVKIDQALKDAVRINDPWGRPYEYTDRTKYSYRLKSQGQRTDTASDDITSGSP